MKTTIFTLLTVILLFSCSTEEITTENNDQTISEVEARRGFGGSFSFQSPNGYMLHYNTTSSERIAIKEGAYKVVTLTYANNPTEIDKEAFRAYYHANYNITDVIVLLGNVETWVTGTPNGHPGGTLGDDLGDNPSVSSVEVEGSDDCKC